MTFETHQTHRTGDINFFSACMAIGIAPCLPEPAEVIWNDDEKRHFLSFRLNHVSECGQHHTQVMDKAWSNPKVFGAEHLNHPFSLVMDFSRSAKGARTKDDWIEKAASFLMISRDAVRKAIKDVSELEVRAPESPLTYIVCFIVNRLAAAQWAKSSIPKNFVSNGPSVVMLDGKLSNKKQTQLLSYL